MLKQKKEIVVIIFILIILIIRGFFIDWYRVPSDSMYPMIERNEHIFINKLAYSLRIPFTKKHIFSWDTPKHGDVIVFYEPKDNTVLVKRVMAISGDIIIFENGEVILNGEKAHYTEVNDVKTEPDQNIKQQGLKETFKNGQSEYILKTLTQREYPQGYNNGRNAGKFIIPENHLMMIGDNRDNSIDSRFIGTIPIDNIIGKVIY